MARALRVAVAFEEGARDSRVGLGVVDRLLGGADRVVEPQSEPEQERHDQERRGEPSAAGALESGPHGRIVNYPALPMRILILGGDGYLGWPTALRFSAEGDNEVAVVDNFNRRRWVEGAGSNSLTPIADLDTRIAAWEERRASGSPPTSGRSRTATSSKASSPISSPTRSSTTASRPRRPTR